MKISIYNVNDDPIGRGGMGQVYFGTDPKGNPVAIKEMLAEYVTDADLRRRFHQEVNILNQLEHQSIVKMYASFEERGNLYLVMEYIEGETIEQYVKRRGIIAENEAVRMLTEILSALGYAHQKGIVHRDIKPSNIMIRPNGTVCLLDFGIAKDQNRSQRLTYMQMSIGTHGYMSPEQADGYDIDHRSDIYSLGCVLFYMLTGRHAIEKQENDYKTCMAILQQPFPQAKVYNPSLSDRIQRILNKATDKNMLMRFQSCREFELELSGGATAGCGIRNDNHGISVGKVDCDIIVPNHPKVSRRHADIIWVNENGISDYLFIDRSTNGSIVNGVSVHNNEIYLLYKQKKPVILLAGEIELKWEDVEAVFAKKHNTTSSIDVMPSTSDHLNQNRMFQNSFSFEGRIRRLEYGISCIMMFVYSFIAGLIVGLSGMPENVVYVFLIPAYWFLWAQGAKRCHDRGNSGWYQLIPFYGFWMLFAEGEYGENDYGLNPKGLGN